MRILVHDYSGHPFQVQLSRALASRGHDVLHVHCPSYLTGKGAVEARPGDADTLELVAIDLGHSFDKYHLVRRLKQEIAYGRRFARLASSFGPDVLLSSNDPLFAKALSGRWCRKSKTPWVYWLQDLYGLAITGYAKDRLGRLGRALGLFAQSIERRLLRQAAAVVPITPDFDPWLRKWSIAPERCEVIENWAPLDELPQLPRATAWSTEHDLDGTTVLLYAGTLGLKHDPSLLTDLAERFSAAHEVRVVVVSEGAGADWLRQRCDELGLDNLIVLPYQPFERLAEVFATADVLLVLLSPDAGVFSVPSKSLSYLCAGRPILAAIPGENLAARTITRAEAGIVVTGDNRLGFLAAADKLVSNPDLRRFHGERARAYAEEHFDVDVIASRFEKILGRAAADQR